MHKIWVICVEIGIHIYREKNQLLSCKDFMQKLHTVGKGV